MANPDTDGKQKLADDENCGVCGQKLKRSYCGNPCSPDQIAVCVNCAAKMICIGRTLYFEERKRGRLPITLIGGRAVVFLAQLRDAWQKYE